MDLGLVIGVMEGVAMLAFRHQCFGSIKDRPLSEFTFQVEIDIAGLHHQQEISRGRDERLGDQSDAGREEEVHGLAEELCGMQIARGPWGVGRVGRWAHSPLAKSFIALKVWTSSLAVQT